VLYAASAAAARLRVEPSGEPLDGSARDGAARECLAAHSVLAAQRASHLRLVLTGLITPAGASELVSEAAAALHAHWELLSGVDLHGK
jgi:hypothetical protein